LRPEQDTKGGEHIVCCGSCYLTVKREWKCLECERMVPAEEVIKLLPGGGIRVAPREVLEKCERITL